MLGVHRTDLLLRQLMLFGTYTVHLVDLLDDAEEHVLYALARAGRYLIKRHFVAKQHGIEATGYAAKDVTLREGLRTKVREAFARLQAVLDVGVLSRKPYFLGPTITIGREAE